MIKYKTEPTYCECHPETCCCAPWSVMKGNKTIARFMHKKDAVKITDAMNKMAQCTCDHNNR